MNEEKEAVGIDRERERERKESDGRKDSRLSPKEGERQMKCASPSPASSSLTNTRSLDATRDSRLSFRPLLYVKT